MLAHQQPTNAQHQGSFRNTGPCKRQLFKDREVRLPDVATRTEQIRQRVIQASANWSRNRVRLKPSNLGAILGHRLSSANQKATKDLSLQSIDERVAADEMRCFHSKARLLQALADSSSIRRLAWFDPSARKPKAEGWLTFTNNQHPTLWIKDGCKGADCSIRHTWSLRPLTGHFGTLAQPRVPRLKGLSSIGSPVRTNCRREP